MTAVDEVFILDRLTVVSLLGIRFRDSATGSVIDDGLSVVAYPADRPESRVKAFTNHKGVFVFRNLPGMRRTENSSGKADFWAAPPDRRRFVIEVRDRQWRFLPALLNVDAPVRGLYRWEHGVRSSPPPPESPVFLYSAPSRRTLPSMAVVRAELLDAERNRPAAWVKVEAVVDGILRGVGVSDDDGKLLLMFPYPEPRNGDVSSPVLSPPSRTPATLFDRTWSVQLAAYYDPTVSEQKIPELESVFEQKPAALWSASSPYLPLGPQILKYGSELLVASRPRPELWITQLSSP